MISSTLPLVAFGLLGSIIVYRAQRDNIGRETLEIARSLAQAVEAEHRVHIAALEALALSTELQGGDVASFHPSAHAFVDTNSPESTLGVADGSGQLLLAVGSRIPPNAVLPRRKNLEVLERVFRTGRPAISDLFLNALNGRATYTVDVPVLRGNRTVYDLGFDPTLASLNDVIARRGLSKKWVISVFDSKGMTAARQPRLDESIGQRAAPSLNPWLMGQSEGIVEATSREGIQLYAAFSHSEPSGWSVAVGVPTTELTDPLSRGLMTNLGVGSLVMLLSLIMAATTAKRITAPIASLAGFAGRRGEVGPSALPINTGLHEVDEVGLVLGDTFANLREREARLRAVLDAAPIGLVFGEAPSGRISGGNAQVERILGHPVLPSSTVAAYGDWIAFHSDGRRVDGHEYPLARALSGAEDRPELEVLYVRGDGQKTWVRFVGAAIRDDAGQITGGVVASLDIDAERRAEIALRELNTKLEQRVFETVAEREKVQAQLRQSQKMEAVGQLTGGVAHDFNNLLTVIMGSLDVVRRRLGDTADHRVTRGIDNAMDGARRAAVLTHRLLAFSRQSSLTPEVIDVNVLVSGMSDLLRRTLGEHVAVETVLAGGLWRCEADPNQLENALLNLAVNASDAMPKGGHLTIETANAHLDEAYVSSLGGEVKSGQFVLVSVTDTGNGMTAEIKARVFEPFFTTKPVGKGTGLGLSQVYGFLRQSGGHAAVYSEPGQGTTLKLYFPRVRVSQKSSLPKVQEAEPHTWTPTGRGELIVVVEDEPMVREFSVAVLEEEGYTVVSAGDGPAGLALLDLHSQSVELLFTDVVLTGPMNGREFADEALRRLPRLKVLFTTGYSRNAIIHHGRLDDDVNLIGKPFTAGSLVEIVGRILRTQ